MVRPLLGVAALAALSGMVACSRSGPVPDVSVAPVTDRVVSAGGSAINISRSTENVAIATVVAAGVDTVFATVLAVYKELAIPLTLVQAQQHIAGNETFKARRRIGGVAMQKYVDCGGTSGEPNAETFDMEISIVTYVVTRPQGGVTLSTRLSALGNDPRFGKDRQMRCSTTCELESWIGKLVKAKLGLK